MRSRMRTTRGARAVAVANMPSAPRETWETRETGEGLPLLLSIDQVAASLGLTRQTVYAKLVTPGVLPSITIGAARRVPRQDLLAYVQRLRTEQLGVTDDEPPAA